VTLVVDASVAVKWLVPEPLTDAAERVLASDEELVVPDLLPIEVANALWKKVRRRELGRDDAVGALELLATLRLDVRSTSPLMPRAVALAVDLGHPVYDCVYLALAEATRGRLVVNDGPLLRAIRGRRGLPRLIPLVRFLDARM
jgi:predicted nucleic acid-binding protein